MSKTKTKNLGYIITITILSTLLVIISALYIFSLKISSSNSQTLENFYQKNFYDLVDNINNTEMKLCKTVNSIDSNYQTKMLEEISKNAYLAQENINNLPYSIGGLDESVAFINQVSGYTETLYKKLKSGQELTNKEMETLNKIYDSVLSIKDSLNEISKELWNGYSILDASLSINGDFNNFTNFLTNQNSTDIDYPAMIYDGPFSDSQVNKKVKGLNFGEVSEDEALKNILKVFADFSQDEIKFIGETNSRFDVYNFSIQKNDQEFGYIQMTKNGGKLLTFCSYNDNKGQNLTIENCKQIALDFGAKAGLKNLEVVWSDIVGDNAFVNLAPIQNNAILYPDLVKVKIDASNGRVLGYEATNYYTNHTNRTISNPTISKSSAEKNINKKFKITDSSLTLIPLNYGEEILCYEFECVFSGDTYYFYIDANTGTTQNILKVIKTDNGNLLM